MRRPIFIVGLADAGEAYDALGHSRTALAHTALPDDVDLLAVPRALANGERAAAALLARLATR